MKTFHIANMPRDKRLCTKHVFAKITLDGKEAYRVRLPSRAVREFRRAGEQIICPKDTSIEATVTVATKQP
jgi:hypothetical protein